MNDPIPLLAILGSSTAAADIAVFRDFWKQNLGGFCNSSICQRWMGRWGSVITTNTVATKTGCQ